MPAPGVAVSALGRAPGARSMIGEPRPWPLLARLAGGSSPSHRGVVFAIAVASWVSGELRAGGLRPVRRALTLWAGLVTLRRG